MKRFIFYILILSSIFSCKYFAIKKADTTNAVAKVYNTYLYKKDIAKVLPKNLTKEDSLLFVKNYINSWAKHEVLLYKAEMNLSEKEQSFDNLVKTYRDDLFINAYKEALINQELNTNVDTQEINDYYQLNKENFKLKEILVKFRYLHFDNDILEKTKLIRLFKSSKEKDLEMLKLRELELKTFHLNDTIWIKYTDLLKEIPPLTSIPKSSLLQKNKFVKLSDSTGVYLVTIKDVLKQHQIAPISYIAPTIKQLILYQRKLELIRKIEQTLVEDAINSKNFEQY